MDIPKLRKAMPGSSTRRLIQPPLALLTALFFLLICPGCGHFSGYLGFLHRQKSLENAYQQQPQGKLLRELAPENCFRLQGPLVLGEQKNIPLLGVAVTGTFGEEEVVVAREVLLTFSFYNFFIPEGEYTLFFFADLDRNGLFEAHELVGQTPSDNPIKVAADRTEDGLTVAGPKVSIDLNGPRRSDFPLQIKVTNRTHTFDSLEDDFFDARYGQMGLYRPTALIAHTQGFFFGLEELDLRKTLVIFVHGIGGTPQDWKYIVQGMDRTRFQPWFFYYPSGLPLERVGFLLARIISDIGKIPDTRLKGVVIVAHSMGGLVGQAAVNKLCRDGTPSYLKMFVSFSTPYGGVEGAKMGVEYAPAVVPSWKDVAAGSPFLEQMHLEKCSPEVPFFLFFGYRDPSVFKSESGSDGTISLASQLDVRKQRTASKMYGFDATHVGILNDEGARLMFNQVLELATPKKGL